MAYVGLYIGVHENLSSIVSENVLDAEHQFLKQGYAPGILIKYLTLS